MAKIKICPKCKEAKLKIADWKWQYAKHRGYLYKTDMGITKQPFYTVETQPEIWRWRHTMPREGYYERTRFEYLIKKSGKYYYDPIKASGFRESQECETSEIRTVPCPSQLRLGFFSLFKLLVAGSLIALIYIWLIFKNKETL